MLKKPRRQLLRPLIWALSFPPVWKHRAKIVKQGMEGLKPPYLLLCNHNAFFDFMVASASTFPYRSNSVVAIDAYTMPIGKDFIDRAWLLRMVGCICKRKFTNDLVLVRHIKRVIENGDIAIVYPEARYSLCGTTAVLPESLGKMCKLLKVPVVTLVMHGHHINSPFWNTGDRGVKPTEAETTIKPMRWFLTAEAKSPYMTAQTPSLSLKVYANDVTGIQGVLSGTKASATWHGLDGKTVDKPQKGIFVKNGKKYLCK